MYKIVVSRNRDIAVSTAAKLWAGQMRNSGSNLC